jgi:hypothetical protein
LSRELLEAELAPAKPDERVKAYKVYHDDIVAAVQYCKKNAEKLRHSPWQSLWMKSLQLEAEIWLLEAQTQNAKGPMAEKNSQRIHKLHTARRDTLREMSKQLGEDSKKGNLVLPQATLDEISRVLLDAELAVADERAKLKHLEAYCEQLKEVEKVTRARLNAGIANEGDYHRSRAARLTAEIAVERAKNAEKDSPQIRKLLKDRLAEVRDEIKVHEARMKAGVAPRTDMLAVAPRLREAELAVASNPAEELKACQVYRDNMNDLEKLYNELYKLKRMSLSDYLSWKAARLQAEIWLLEAKSRVPAPKK